jgi:predicted O-linked N-acetylglucosamine transferase (SPINDLY family)
LSTIAETLALGTQYHQAGQLAEAETLYRRVLQLEPDNAQALHALGILAMQSRRFEVAAELIRQAIRGDRNQSAFYANLGEAYRHLQKTSEAIDCCRKALRLQPNLAHVHSTLGMLLRGENKLDEAAAALREALRLRPDESQARLRLGQVLEDQKQLAEAEACFRRVLRSDPNAAEPHVHLASVLHAQGKRDEAAQHYRAALAINRNDADAHTNLGTVLHEQKKHAEATAHFQAALAARPNAAVSHVNLGTNHQALGRLDEAAACYRAALAIEPDNPLAHNALGTVLVRQGKPDEALAEFDAALRANPRSAESHLNRATALQAQGKLVPALAALEEALRLDPTSAAAFINIGMIRNEQGKRDEAIAACRRAIELAPEAPEPHNNLAIALSALGRHEEAIVAARRSYQLSPLEAAERSNLLYMLNFPGTLDAQALFDEHRAWAAAYPDTLTANSAPHTNDRTPDRRLRVGYVSAHFMSHAVNFFSEPILASHDHEQVEVFCFAHVDRGDETTQRLRSYADHWRDIVHRSDEEAAAMVRDDQIDILVDLSGHIGGNRLLLFARKPAPVQVTYIGYQNTTGMAAMDYRLTDAWADPPGTTDAFYTEKLVRLPRSFFCYQPSDDAPPVNALPSLEKGHVTFGSFNAFSKVTPTVLDTWAGLLAALPDSRLIIVANVCGSLVESLTRIFESHGVRTDRLTLADRRPRGEYLELIRQCDIALDPFPFNGHTTTCDALWQGLPVVTLAGQSYASRFGSSAHHTLGLTELVARTREQYLEIALGLAHDLARLAELRAGLRERMAGSPLLDFAGFTRNLEAAYRKMWIDWCTK